MKPQTEDNLRCLAAALIAITVMVGVAATQPAWFMTLPGWLQYVAACGLLFVLLHLFNSRRIVKPDRVSFDDSQITHTMANGMIETVRWDDLREVGIVTTDEGPWAEDVFWILLGSNGDCAISGGALGMKRLLARLQELPGFNNEAVIKAMGSTSNDKFVCWKRD